LRLKDLKETKKKYVADLDLAKDKGYLIEQII